MTSYATTKRCMALLDPTTKRLPIRWRDMAVRVCRRHGACLGDVMAGWRGRRAVKARHALWFAIHETYGSSFAEIGRRFGFHHTTVMHGVSLHAQRLAGIDGQQY